jgi:hypothetical protein
MSKTVTQRKSGGYRAAAINTGKAGVPTGGNPPFVHHSAGARGRTHIHPTKKTRTL